MSIEIAPNERGMIRVFAVNRPPEDVQGAIADSSKAAVAAELLGTELPETGFELFPAEDLTGVGLAGYLQEGYAVEADQIAAERGRLDALEGYVLLVFSEAFAGAAATLAPGPDLTLIGRFGEAQPDMTTQPISSDAAQPHTGVPRQTPTTPPKGGAGSVLTTVAVVVLLGLIVWWALG